MRAHIRGLVENQHLPDYAVEIEDDIVTFKLRADKKAPMPPLAVSAAAAIPPSLSERRIMVSTQAIERLYKTAPGWDKYMLERIYIEWAKDKEAARNEDARS